MAAAESLEGTYLALLSPPVCMVSWRSCAARTPAPGITPISYNFMRTLASFSVVKPPKVSLYYLYEASGTLCTRMVSGMTNESPVMAVC